MGEVDGETEMHKGGQKEEKDEGGLEEEYRDREKV